MRLIFDIISSDKRLNAIMHACDVFEPSKQLGDFHQFEAESEPGCKLEEVVPKLKIAFEQAGKVVVFLSIRAIDNRINDKYPAFIMDGVSSLSNGRQWALFKDILERIGYESKYDDQMRVLSAKIKIK